MKPVLIKTSKCLINLNNVTAIEKVTDQGSMKYGIRFALYMQQTAIYEYYDTEIERDDAYEALSSAFGYML